MSRFARPRLAMQYEAIGMVGAIGDSAAAIALLAPDFAGLAHEELRFVHLDRWMRVLRVSSARGPGDDAVELPLRAVIRDALLLDAEALIVAHNHPSGDPTPSAADKAVTRRLAEVARPLGIRVIDHLIFTGEAVASFRALGLV